MIRLLQRPGNRVATTRSVAGTLQRPVAASRCRRRVTAARKQYPGASQERYRRLEAAVTASGSIAGPATAARGVAEARSAAVAAIGDVAWDVSVRKLPRPRAETLLETSVDLSIKLTD